MKILHVIWDLGVGGAQAYLSNLVRTLNEKHGLATEVIVLTSPGVFSGIVKKSTSGITYIGMKSGFDMIAAVRLLGKLKSSDADIIHVHTNTIVANIAYAISNTPIIYTEHGIGVRKNSNKERFSRFLLYSFFCRWISNFIAVSENMRKKMIVLNPGNTFKITTIPNGVDLDKIVQTKQIASPYQNGKLKGKYKICTVGRLAKIKDIDLFIQTAKSILNKNNNVSFYIIGDGELRPNLEALANELNISEAVHFLGFRDDVAPLMEMFDLYLMTSHFESFGLTIIEAMCSGVPVVAAKADWPSDEIIDNGINGILMDNRDPDLIADKVCSLLINEEQRHNMGLAAKIKVESNFSIDRNAQSIYNCYLKLISK